MARSREQEKAMFAKDFHRLKDFEGENVKLAVANKDESVIGTLIQSTDFPDEMEIRVTSGSDRFAVRGSKSILSKLTPEELSKKVELHLERHEDFKK